MISVRSCLVAGSLVIVSMRATNAQQQHGQAAAAAKPATCAEVRAVDPSSSMDHAAHLAALAECDTAVPTLAGQAAYAAIGEIVRMLKGDPNTDWSKVNIEALRQHLIDMDEVTMRSAVTQRPVEGGIVIDVTGTGRTEAAIRRMAIAHGSMLDLSDDYHASAVEIRGGARITVTAENHADARVVARIRGLGFAGLFTEGDHHAPHHLALARGTSAPHSRQ